LGKLVLILAQLLSPLVTLLLTTCQVDGACAVNSYPAQTTKHACAAAVLHHIMYDRRLLSLTSLVRLSAPFCGLLVQLLAQVSYLKAINSTYQPVHALHPTTTRLMCHGARHKSTRDILEGWAAAALRPVATLLQPLQTVIWSDTHPSGRDLEAALAAATEASSGSIAAKRQLLQGVPIPKPANPAIRAPTPPAPAASSRGPVGIHALNRFCWDTATRPYTAEAAELAARASLPRRTDQTPAEVQAAKEAAARAAEAAVAHALLLSTLPVWFAPGETGGCSKVLQAAANMLPMPAYGLSLDLDAAAAGSGSEGVFDSLPELAAHCVAQLLAIQRAGPFVLVGCGVFSCMLAAAMASVLEHQMQQQQVVLVLLDGPPALPSSHELPDPVLYGLYQVLWDAGKLPAALEGSPAPLGFAGFAAEVSIRVQAALAPAGESSSSLVRQGSGTSVGTAGTAWTGSGVLLGPVPEDMAAALNAAVLQVASDLLGIQVSPAAAAAAGEADSGLAAALQRMLRVCRVVRSMSSTYAPEWVYQVPVVLLLTDDVPGQAFLEVARERWVT
jgi:hypothetical protein